jgi:hypothetical protein
MKTVIAVIAAMAYPVAPGGFVLVIHSSAQVIAMAYENVKAQNPGENRSFR